MSTSFCVLCSVRVGSSIILLACSRLHSPLLSRQQTLSLPDNVDLMWVHVMQSDGGRMDHQGCNHPHGHGWHLKQLPNQHGVTQQQLLPDSNCSWQMLMHAGICVLQANGGRVDHKGCNHPHGPAYGALTNNVSPSSKTNQTI